MVYAKEVERKMLALSVRAKKLTVKKLENSRLLYVELIFGVVKILTSFETEEKNFVVSKIKLTVTLHRITIVPESKEAQNEGYKSG